MDGTNVGRCRGSYMIFMGSYATTGNHRIQGRIHKMKHKEIVIETMLRPPFVNTITLQEFTHLVVICKLFHSFSTHSHNYYNIKHRYDQL